MKFAIVGTGFVADYYMTTLANHPGIELAGAWDRSRQTLDRFSRFHSVRTYVSLDHLLDDPGVEIVANLTGPESHHAISMAALGSGKHVYSEKPLALTLSDAAELAAEAQRRGLGLACAPATVYSDAFALVRDALASGVIGQPRLAYAEMEDGQVFRDDWRSWRSVSGAPWPGAQEFELGCTLEHAGYALAWLVELFGNVSEIRSFSTTLFPDKGTGTPAGTDFSVGCLTFGNGMVARITCGLAATRNRTLVIHGTAGTLTVADLWDNRSSVRVAPAGVPSGLTRIVRRLEALTGHVLTVRFPDGRSLPYRHKAVRATPAFPSRIDFSAGIARLAEAVRNGDDLRKFSDRALHLAELTLVLNQGAERHAFSSRMPAVAPEPSR